MSARILSASLFCVVWLGSSVNSVSAAAPHPGTEDSLRRYVESLEAGQPNYDEMTPRMAEVVRRQLPGVLAVIKQLGALKSISFESNDSQGESSDSQGADIYLVSFEHGNAEWTIGPLTADGKVERRGFRIIDDSYKGVSAPPPPIGHEQNSAAKTTLDGWENYKFGMTPDQVRAIPGVSWAPLFTTSSGEKISLLTSRTSSSRYGIDFGQVRLTFSADLKLTGIALRYAEAGKSPDDCEKQFQTLLPILEHQYGVFKPAVPQNDGLLGLGSSTVWRDVPGSKSQYSYGTVQSFGVIGTIFNADAKHMIGAGFVEARMTASNGERESCGLDASFHEK